VEIRGDRAVAVLEGKTFSLELHPRVDGSTLALFDGGRVIRARVFPGKNETRLSARGRLAVFELFDPREEIAGATAAGAASEVLAAMPGRVVEVKVREGDSVEAGDLLLILEAMKMQNEIRAEAQGTVSAVQCEAGQAVDSGAVLIRF
jgi:biotin carboxyl carrier protein